MQIPADKGSDYQVISKAKRTTGISNNIIKNRFGEDRRDLIGQATILLFDKRVLVSNSSVLMSLLTGFFLALKLN